MGGRNKRRIGRIHKNSEKKRQILKVNKPGRPRKVKRRVKSQIDNIGEFDTSVSPTLPADWSKISYDDHNEYVKLSRQGAKGGAVITRSVKIFSDLTWKVHVHGKEVNKTKCVPLRGISERISDEETATKLFHILTSVNVCPGHPDKHFIEFVNSKNGRLLSKDKTTVAFVDGYASVTLNGESILQSHGTFFLLRAHDSWLKMLVLYSIP